ELVSAGGVAPGQLAPLTQVGAMSVNAAVRLIDRGAGSGGAPSLALHIAGETDANYDHVDAESGVVEVAGRVQVNLIGGFQPSLGDSFEIIRAGTRTGAFGVAYFPPIPSGLLMTVEYAPTGVSLIVEAIGASISFAGPSELSLPGTPSDAALGDLDNDGDLDVALCIQGTSGSNGAVHVLREGRVDGQGNRN